MLKRLLPSRSCYIVGVLLDNNHLVASRPLPFTQSTFNINAQQQSVLRALEHAASWEQRPCAPTLASVPRKLAYALLVLVLLVAVLAL